MIPGLSLIGAGADSCVINTQALLNAQDFIAVEVKDSCILKGFHVIVYYNNEKGRGAEGYGNCLIEFNRVSKSARGFNLNDTGNSIPNIYKNNINDVLIGIYIFNSSPIIKENIIVTSYNFVATINDGIYIGAFGPSYAPLIESNYVEIIE